MRNTMHPLRLSAALFVSLVALGTGGPVSLGAAPVAVSTDIPAAVDEDATVSASVVVTAVTDLNAAQFDVSFDPTVLELTSVSNGEIGGTTIPCQSNDMEPGRWRVVASLGTGVVSGSGSLAVLHFSITGIPGDESAVEFSNGILSGLYEAIDATWADAYVSVRVPPVPPTVISSYPAADAVDIPITCSLSATFSEDMDAGTITDTSFALEEGGVTGTVSYDADSRTAYFFPAAELENGTAYTAKLDASVADSSGVTLGTPYVWTFSTQAGCFIATAAYGSSLDPRLDTLRAFRDNYLLTNAPGRAFVAFYYKTSPSIAAFIEERPALGFWVRVLLWPMVLLAEMTLRNPWVPWGVGLAAAGGIMAAFRKRGTTKDAQGRA